MERIALQEFYSEVMSADIRLGGIMNGHDIGVVNAARGIHLIVKAHQEFQVIEKFTVQGFGATRRLPTPISSAKKTVPISLFPTAE